MDFVKILYINPSTLNSSDKALAVGIIEFFFLSFFLLNNEGVQSSSQVIRDCGLRSFYKKEQSCQDIIQTMFNLFSIFYFLFPLLQEERGDILQFNCSMHVSPFFLSFFHYLQQNLTSQYADLSHIQEVCIFFFFYLISYFSQTIKKFGWVYVFSTGQCNLIVFKEVTHFFALLFNIEKFHSRLVENTRNFVIRKTMMVVTWRKKKKKTKLMKYLEIAIKS